MRKLLIIFFYFGFLMISSHEVLAQEEKTDNQLIEELINKKKEFNKAFGYGYRIQLYNGFEVEAKKIRAEFRIEYPEVKTYLVYRQPEWKIQVGSYKTKLEADRALLEIKKKFSNAIVIPLGR